MRILALVPARAGSKRLPGKNSRLLGGRPLLVWSIEIARDIPEICDILVSTDDAEIARIGREAGALAPWLRPADLSGDEASSVDVCLHALGWYERERGDVDGLLLLQPTSPFRTRDTILRGIELFRLNGRRPVVGVSPAASHPMWCFRIEGGSLRPFIDDAGAFGQRSQDLPPAWVVNGGFYLISPDDLRRKRSFFGDTAVPLVFESDDEAVDIDTAADWNRAEGLLNRR